MKKKNKSLWLAVLVLSAGVPLAAAESVTLFRVFLNDGTAVVSYGEFARVGDRVVFSMPIRSAGVVSSTEPVLQVVNIPATAVDWDATSEMTSSRSPRIVAAVPDELKPSHALLQSAVNLADSAVRMRRQAALSGELATAWDASSAAAGSMMLLSRAREDMEATVTLPHIR
jgi:hypothetical protein